jgi:acetoin:2,6-dichlorophenolindophenol oxidoreductase subunit alpha
MQKMPTPPPTASAASEPVATEPVVSEDTRDGLELYRRMVLIRRFEERVQSLFQKGLVHGTTHLYNGQEAGAVGVNSVLGVEDRVACTYRNHGHALALGTDPERLLAELMGRTSGVCGGRGGSMNIIDFKHRLIGSFGIIGGSMAAAVGAALAQQRRGGVAVAFFGDGTANHGYFHECLNFAKVRRLPVVFVCENNGYGEFTPWRAVTAGQITARPEAMGIATQTIDGNDVWVVRDCAAAAVKRARAGEGPQFLESITYRYVGHSRSDPGKYRPPGELDEWKARDPLLHARAVLDERFGIEPGELDKVDSSVDELIEQITAKATAAEFPDPAAPVREFKP